MHPARSSIASSSAVERDGGAVIGRYSDPFGGKPLVIAALPVEKVEPTPYQRDPSDAHVKRLMGVMETIWAASSTRSSPCVTTIGYWTPNGNHRLQALKKLGVRTIVALLVPDADVAFKILALNTEKAHNLREKSLETIRMARALDGRARRRARNGVRVRVRAAGVPHARRLLRGAAALQRRRVSVDPPARGRVPRRAGAQSRSRSASVAARRS